MECTYLGFIANKRFWRKLNISSLKDCVLLEDGGLALVMSKGFLAIEALVENHTYGPYIYFARYLWRSLTNYKTFWRQIPGSKKLELDMKPIFIINKII